MPGQIGVIGHANVEGEHKLGHDRERDESQQPPENSPVELGAFVPQQPATHRQHGDDDVLADHLEGRQAAALHISGGEVAPYQHRGDQRSGDRRQRQQQQVDAYSAAYEERRGQQDEGLQIARRQPELRRGVGAFDGQDGHALEDQHVHRVDHPGKEQPHPQHAQVAVAHKGQRVPGQHKDGKGHHNTV